MSNEPRNNLCHFFSHRSFSKWPELDVEVLSELLVGWVELLCDEIPRVWAQRLVVHPYGDFGLEEALLGCDMRTRSL